MMTEDAIRDRLQRFGAGPATADWREVRSRGIELRRKRRIRFAGLAAVVAALALAATPAFGLGARVIDFFQSEPAPEALKVQLAELNTGAPPGMSPCVDAAELRAVMTRELYNGPYTLWVAPTKDGNFCVHFGRAGRDGGSGGCIDRRIVPIYPNFAQANSGKPILAFGSVTAEGATHVELELDNGKSVEAELVWVSEPIDAGFYATDVREGKPTAVVARDGDGNEVARLAFPKPVGIPPGR
jgi:hypothetical protein